MPFALKQWLAFKIVSLKKNFYLYKQFILHQNSFPAKTGNRIHLKQEKIICLSHFHYLLLIPKYLKSEPENVFHCLTLPSIRSISCLVKRDCYHLPSHKSLKSLVGTLVSMTDSSLEPYFYISKLFYSKLFFR